MIRRLRWKITGVTMLVAFMVLLAVFGGVYFFSQANIAQSYIHQLKQAVQTGVVDGRFPCFVAEVLPSGTVRVSGSSYYDLDDEEALLDAVSQALADGGESGVLSQRHLRFYRQDGVLTVRIAFMDSTFEQATLRSLVKVCLLIGLGALLVLLGLVLHAPIAIFCFIMATESALKVPFGLHRIRSGKWIHDVTQDLNA